MTTLRQPPALTAIGTPRTWTGKAVSWAEWGRLSDWERFGPDGRLWCGIARDWRRPTPAEVARDAAERAVGQGRAAA